MIKKIYNSILRILPFKYSILQIAAKLPLQFKTHLFFRVVSNISQYCNPNTFVESNFGIHNSLRLKVKIMHSVQAFGTPKLYKPEFATLELASIVMQHTDAFFDIGSHIGYFCYYLENNNPKRKPIYFFEPDPDLYKAIAQNKTNNNLHNINGCEVALSNRDGELIFYKNNSDSYSGSIKNTFQDIHDVQEVIVKTSTFDTFVKHLPYQHYTLKVDVESAEADFLEGAKSEMHKIQYLIIELLQDAIEQELPKFLIEDLKFNAFYINNFELVHSKNGEFNYSDPYYNWLFTRDSIEELSKKLIDSQFTIKP